MLAALMAASYRGAQAIKSVPPDEVLFPILTLGAWLLFLYWVFAGPRAVRIYRKAYKNWAQEKRLMAYLLAIGMGTVIGGATGAGFWKVFEVHREQMKKLAASEAKPTKDTPPAKEQPKPETPKPAVKPPTAQEIAAALAKDLPQQPPKIAGYGNLKKRTEALCEEIQTQMAEKHKYYWDNTPNAATSARASTAVEQAVSVWFKAKFLLRVRDLRDEYAQHNYKNDDLEEFLRADSEETNAMTMVQKFGGRASPRILGKRDFDRVTSDLTALAAQLNN